MGESPHGEPFVVPLATPAIAGPAAIATVVLLSSAGPATLPARAAAIGLARSATFVVLIAAERVSALVGARALAALERLMGLILTSIAVEMLLRGIASFVHRLAEVPR